MQVGIEWRAKAVDEDHGQRWDTASAQPEMRARLQDLGVEPADFTLEHTNALFRSALENQARAVKASGAKSD